MKLTMVLLAVLLTGCATTGGQDMSAEQLRAVAADKNFSAVCSTVTGLWGQGKFVFVNIDKSVVVNGAISVDANCLVTMSNGPATITKQAGAVVNVPLPVAIIPHLVQ
jgi:ABC-type Fe3+-hydroxamate transport system substrate-binding protein